MLGLDFEEFELISSKEELWILESREEIFSDEEIIKIRDKVETYYNSISFDTNLEFNEGYVIIDNVNRVYGDFLLDYLNNDFNNIKLTRRYLDD